MKVFVSGPEDALGAQVAKKLEEAGQTVIGPFRSANDSNQRPGRSADVVVLLNDLGIGSDATAEQMYETNVTEPLRVLEDVPPSERVVLLSSVQVYAPTPSPLLWPISEDAPLRAHGNRRARLYGQQKIDVESRVADCARRGGYEYVILRSTLRYGTGEGLPELITDRLLANPRRAAAEYDSLGVMQWISTDAVASALVLAVESQVVGDEVMTIAGAQPTTSWDLSEILQRRGRAWSRETRVKFDTAKAETMLGWEPDGSFLEWLLSYAGHSREPWDSVRSSVLPWNWADSIRRQPPDFGDVEVDLRTFERLGTACEWSSPGSVGGTVARRQDLMRGLM